MICMLMIHSQTLNLTSSGIDLDLLFSRIAQSVLNTYCITITVLLQWLRLKPRYNVQNLKLKIAPNKIQYPIQNNYYD